MVDVLAQFGDSSSGLGALGLNLSSFLIQLGTFIVALLILRQWAFKPILKMLRERRDTIEKGVELGQQMQQEKHDLEQKVEKILHEARSQADEIITSAHGQARQSIQEAEESARTKAETIVNEADERIKQQTARAWRNLERELGGLVAEATEAIIHEKLDAKKDALLIDEALKNRKVAA